MSERQWILVNESGKIVLPGMIIGDTFPIEKVTKVIDKYSIETTKNGDDEVHTRTIPSGWRIFEGDDIQVLLGNIADWYSMMLSWKRRTEVAEKVIDQAVDQMKEDIAGTINPADYVEQNRDLMQILGINETRTVKLELSLTYEIEVELDWATDIDELDGSDFEGGDPFSSTYDIAHADLTDSSLREL